ncbi:MAG: hypothetical protein CVU85_00535 [Firmicutes bacterium HGW-Firmicutes-10]|jgi:uncharacterized protein YdhG (YjbR/CyaY superfamily)|nr:MAG: hypothetical protein CVU85_00535 [Firmicutes bacterium HGW-Firmicutes-10]
MEKKIIETVDEYILMFKPEVQAILKEIRTFIQRIAPQTQETISYQMPTYKYYGNLVHFAAHAHHIGFYPGPEGIEAFKDRFVGLKYSKGAVQFDLDKPIPYELIEEIVNHRLNENLRSHLEKLEKKKKK